MTLQDLQSIINYARVEPHRPVRVMVNYSGTGEELCDILSFNTYSDGIVLNIVASEKEGGEDNG